MPAVHTRRRKPFGLFPSRMFTLLSVIAFLAVTACSSDGEPLISEQVELGGPEFSAFVITTDIAIGENQIAFAVMDREGLPVQAEPATVQAYFLAPRQDSRELKSSVLVQLLPWPTATRGVFSATLEFETAGAWELEVDFINPDGDTVTAKAAVIVKAESETPSIGAPAPAAVTLTARDVEDLSHITSSSEPDPDLYQLSVHEAIAADKPFVVVFATPAFCTSATCGPQLAELTEVKEKYAGRANFIHVEVFKDPHLIQSERPTGGFVPAVLAWGLPSEPWTFIVDARGLVSAKFQLFTPSEALEKALLEAF